MKYFILNGLFICPFYCHCQDHIPLTISNGDVVFEAIVHHDSLTAEEIHERTLNWMGSRLKNAQFVIADSPERIVRQFHFRYSYGLSWEVYNHEISIEIKENETRFTILVIGLGDGIVKNNLEWRTWFLTTRNLIEDSLNELYRSYLEELRANSAEW